MPRSIQLSVGPVEEEEGRQEQSNSDHIGKEAPSKLPVSGKNSFPGTEKTATVEDPAPPTRLGITDSTSKTDNEVPRLAFAVRLSENFKPGEDIKDLFIEWLRNIPTIAKEVKIEAGFDSFSTLLIVSLPLSIFAYLPHDPSIISLGPIISGNRIPHDEAKEDVLLNSKFPSKTSNDSNEAVWSSSQGIHTMANKSPRPARNRSIFTPIEEPRSMIYRSWVGAGPGSSSVADYSEKRVDYKNSSRNHELQDAQPQSLPQRRNNNRPMVAPDEPTHAHLEGSEPRLTKSSREDIYPTPSRSVETPERTDTHTTAETPAELPPILGPSLQSQRRVRPTLGLHIPPNTLSPPTEVINR